VIRGFVGRGRPRAEDHLKEIALGLAVGKSIAQVAREIDMPYRSAWLRANTVRHQVAEALEDSNFLDLQRTTWVQAGRRWCELRGMTVPD